MTNYERAMIDARALTVTNVATRQMAADLFDAIRAFRKQSQEQKELVIRPLKQQYDNAKVPFDTFEQECKTHEKAIADKMSAYDREIDRLARVEQVRLQAIADRANAKIIVKAETKGIEPVLRVAPVVPTVPTTIVTQAGTKQIRVGKTVYAIEGVGPGADVRANDPRVTALSLAYPSLFVFDWVLFRKLASTGVLDQVHGVTSRIEYIYQQRGA